MPACQQYGAAVALHPVILSGGAGTRLWPLSRASKPKQFLPLTSERTLFQETLRRLDGLEGLAVPVVVSNEEHRFFVLEQLDQIGIRQATVLIEPEGRNTAPAIAVAALTVQQEDPDGLILVLPSDHAIGDPEAFRAAVRRGIPAAEAGWLVAFGIEPTAPETGYGYIRRGGDIAGAPGCQAVLGFLEKPSRDRATALIAAGDCDWNAGIFLMSAAVYLRELAQLQPDMLDACRRAVTEAESDLGFVRLQPDAFRQAASVSIDYAVMEKTHHAAVVPCRMDWSDLGSFSALWAHDATTGGSRAEGPADQGRTYRQDSDNTYLRSSGPLVAALGVQDLAVIATDDAVLVAGKEHLQAVGGLVRALESAGLTEALTHSTVYRPWGSYRCLVSGERFQVKHLIVKPGRKLSLQRHFHRAEHWVITHGTAQVTLNGEAVLLTETQAADIPVGAWHRLENPGLVPLEIIEVQVGAYLGEDDIERRDDDYGRV